MKFYKILMSLVFTTQLVAQVNVNGPVAYYNLNNNANDYINQLNGTTYSMTSAYDRFTVPADASLFTGTPGGYITLPNSPLLKTEAVSFSGWIKLSPPNGNQMDQVIIHAFNECSNYVVVNGTNNYALLLRYNSDSAAYVCNLLTVQPIIVWGSNLWAQALFFLPNGPLNPTFGTM